jgi:hypothetical protein
MLTVKEWMELVDYRITEGGDYGWSCYGDNVHILDSWNGDQKGHSFTVIFDTKTQAVYEVQAHDYVYNRAYRLINPEFKAAHDLEANQRDVNLSEAWDDVDYVDLESDDDFIQKGLSIKAGEDYDTRVSVPLDLPDDIMFELMKQAHEQDITFNELMEQIIIDAINKVKQDPDSFKEDFAEFVNKSPAKMKAKKKKK